MAKNLFERVNEINSPKIAYNPEHKSLYIEAGQDINGFLAKLREIIPNLVVSDIGVKGISESDFAVLGQFTEISNLGLSHMTITSSTAKLIGSFGDNLKRLSLIEIKISNELFEEHIGKLSKLEDLALHDTKVSEDVLMRTLPRFKEIEEMTLRGLKFGEKLGAVVCAIAKEGKLYKVYTNLGKFEFGKWQAFIDYQIQLNKLALQLPELSESMQKELDIARATLKAPNPNTHEGDAGAGVEQGKGKQS